MHRRWVFMVWLGVLLVSSSGVTAAWPAAQHLHLDQSTEVLYTSGRADERIVISGQLIDAEDEPVVDEYVVLTNRNKPWDVCRTNESGRFSLVLPGNAPVGRYLLRAPGNLAEITLLPQFALHADLDITWDELQNEGFVYELSGALAFAPPSYTHIALQSDDGRPLAVAPLSGSGHFACVVERERFTKPGELRLVLGTGDTPSPVDDLIIARGELTPGRLKIAIGPSSLGYDLPQVLTAFISVPELAADVYDVEIVYQVVDEWGKSLHPQHPLSAKGRLTRMSEGVQIRWQWDSGALRSHHAGRYRLLVAAKLSGVTYYEGSAEFSIQRPAQRKLIGLPESISVGEGLDLRFGWNGAYVVHQVEGIYHIAPCYQVSVAGVVNLPSVHMAAGESLALRPLQAGPLQLNVIAYGDAAYRNRIGEYTAEIRVQGGHIECDRESVEIGETSVVTFRVFDEARNPINNAHLCITQQSLSDFLAEPAGMMVDSTDGDIIDGKYSIDLGHEGADLVQSLGEYMVYAVQEGQLIAAAPFRVVGAEVYRVALDQEVILAGEQTWLVARVTDEMGSLVVPEEAEISYTDESGSMVCYSASFQKLTDMEGKEVCRIRLLPPEVPGRHIITVKTHNGRQVGRAVVTAILPELSCDKSVLTSGVKNQLTIELTNPITGEPLDWDLAIRGEAYARVVQAQHSGEGQKKRVAFLVDSDLTSATLLGVKPQVTIAARGLDLGSLEVRPVLFSLDPQSALAGTSCDLVATLADAEGCPLPHYRVIHGLELKSTGDNGQATFHITTVRDSPIEFTALLDIGHVSAVLQPVADQTAPTISYPASVSRSTATITISDNARLTRVRVDGTELEVGVTDKLTHQVSLQVGSNRFQVEAEDYSGNITQREIVITYIPPSVVLRGDDVLRIGGYSLVPVGELRTLGAEPSWSISAGTATVSAAGRRVEMAVGSTIAMVNGSPAMMPVAPVSVRGRIYVPVRFVADNLGWSVLWQPGDVITLTAR